MIRQPAAVIVAILGAVALSPAQSLPHLQASSSAYPLLKHLTEEIGPRVTGSPASRSAIAWSQASMQQMGLKNVHVEPWTLSAGWQRGIARATLVSPFELALNISAYGWSGSTPPHADPAEVIEVNSGRNRWAGKILLLPPEHPGHSLQAYAQLPALVAEATKAGAIAIIRRDERPGTMLTHVEPITFGMPVAGGRTIPVIDIAAEQEHLIADLLKSKTPVRIRLDVQNTTSSNPVESANIVGDIPGSTHPEQIVILCAHLDSWDLGTGAIDDGFGVAAVLGAAQSLLTSGVKPLRTIRFIVFTGEEQGLLGSSAYVAAHSEILANIICAFSLDWGQGPITKLPFAGHSEFKVALDQFAAAASDIQKFEVTPGYLFATDAYSFTLAGLPGIALYQDSPGYSLLGHSAADTLDKVDSKVLEHDSGILALISFWVADYPSRLGEMWPSQKTADVLTKDNQKQVLDLLGLWHFPASRYISIRH